MNNPDDNTPLASVVPPRMTRSDWMLWGSWLLGAASLAGVVALALHFSSVEEFTQLLQRVEPGWFALALAFQVLTYLAQGLIYRLVSEAGHARLSMLAACKLGVLKLFFDQALPTYGISGTLAVTAAFERLAIPRPVFIANLVISVLSYLFAYVLALGWALGIVVVEGHATPLMVVAFTLFTLGSVILALGITLLTGRRPPLAVSGITKWGIIKRSVAILNQADVTLTRNLRLLAVATGLDLSIMLLDATTLWVLVRSMGEPAPWNGVFAGFMLASLLRSIGVTPGGLGFFEGAAVTALHGAGIPLPEALSATLLFRGLSFWAPMLPGIFVSRSALRAPKTDSSGS